MNMLQPAALPRGLKYLLKLNLDFSFCNFLKVVKNNGKIIVQLIGELSWQRSLKSNVIVLLDPALKQHQQTVSVSKHQLIYYLLPQNTPF